MTTSKPSPIPSCPFCSPEIGRSVFFRAEGFMALYNIAPALPGHSLVVPERHVESLLSLSESEMARFIQVSKKTLEILLSAFQTEAFDWTIQEKPEAGQTIPHLHLHIVPRISGDLGQAGDWYPLLQKNDAVVVESMHRPRLHADEMGAIVAMLRHKAADLFGYDCGVT